MLWVLQAAVLAQGEALWDAAEQRRSNAFLKGRAQNTQRYKPGTQEVLLMFSDKEGGSVYRFPYHDRFKNVLEPLLEQVTTDHLSFASVISMKPLCAPSMFASFSALKTCSWLHACVQHGNRYFAHM